MAHTDTAWTRLAARTARGLLARKGCAFQELAASLSAMGISESFRGAESKVQRGTFTFAYFLAILKAVGGECSQQWKHFIDSEDAWEVAASHVILHEINSQGLNIQDLSGHLERFGISLNPDRLVTQLSSGQFPFTLLLQLALVVPIADLSRFVDQCDILEAAGTADTGIDVAERARRSGHSKRTQRIP
ncbi:DUF6471 domain-containing protein [Cupriavidus necator]|uniref:DUF6471 domain-containing protein n=1 Tax=Cupriavidus necator TaxID=106590 RepID=UPI001C10F41B|nr:DUF6471 domain-containing protein [Cupriavidus necator]